jgi:4-deoxy-L-threo-5-hexosulose-uronate ketol-isomerase
LEDLFVPGEVRLVLSLQDRLVLGGARPQGSVLSLPVPDELRARHFCERRELAIVCLEGHGAIEVDGAGYTMTAEDILYVAKGARSVELSGDDPVFYLISAPAHEARSTVLARRDGADAEEIGQAALASRRTLRKYVHDGGVKSCQLTVGITTLAEGSVWNTMPCHTHERRSEVYLYFGLGDDGRVLHLCGRPTATRNVVLADRQAVISPPWSVHTGAGTRSYKFVWSTAGENLTFNDMDMVDTRTLR